MTWSQVTSSPLAGIWEVLSGVGERNAAKITQRSGRGGPGHSPEALASSCCLRRRLTPRVLASLSPYTSFCAPAKSKLLEGRDLKFNPCSPRKPNIHHYPWSICIHSRLAEQRLYATLVRIIYKLIGPLCLMPFPYSKDFWICLMSALCCLITLIILVLCWADCTKSWITVNWNWTLSVTSMCSC